MKSCWHKQNLKESAMPVEREATRQPTAKVRRIMQMVNATRKQERKLDLKEMQQLWQKRHKEAVCWQKEENADKHLKDWKQTKEINDSNVETMMAYFDVSENENPYEKGPLEKKRLEQKAEQLIYFSANQMSIDNLKKL